MSDGPNRADEDWYREQTTDFETRGVIEGPRWADTSGFIKDVSHVYGIQCDVDVDRGWVMENIRYKLSGPFDKVVKAENEIVRAIKNYNQQGRG